MDNKINIKSVGNSGSAQTVSGQSSNTSHSGLNLKNLGLFLIILATLVIAVWLFFHFRSSSSIVAQKESSQIQDLPNNVLPANFPDKRFSLDWNDNTSKILKNFNQTTNGQVVGTRMYSSLIKVGDNYKFFLAVFDAFQWKTTPDSQSLGNNKIFSSQNPGGTLTARVEIKENSQSGGSIVTVSIKKNQ